MTATFSCDQFETMRPALLEANRVRGKPLHRHYGLLTPAEQVETQMLLLDLFKARFLAVQCENLEIKLMLAQMKEESK